ncbi:RagB/SusD family nutrient uptake outer membrane protein [Parapedobacter sp. 2B3]|uniref:RagB/SusD family nutrient uptake outer membrane protein n=1 Tax=Parapedobacter sp. 2B3 TaxID=3342381 RepID=UPI0035B63BA3
MKTILYSLSSALLLLTSCESFLTVEPKEELSGTNAITDGASALTAINGVYNGLGADAYYGWTYPAFGYLSGDNVQWTGSQNFVQQFIDHDISTDNTYIAQGWAGIYEVIDRANHVIAAVPGLPLQNDFDQATKDQYTGEAHFIRGLAYFDLARAWGGVQIVTEPTLSSSDKRGIPRSSLDQTYAQVLADLDQAFALLPETVNRFRATKNTVRALKARFHLYQGDWALAEQFATEIINQTNNYELIGPYGSFFTDNVRGTKESIFELFYSANNTNGHRTFWQSSINGGQRQWAPNDALVALLNTPTTGGNRNVLIAQDNQGKWYGNLYYRSPFTDPAYILRIAEQYLIRAEAKARIGEDLTGALADLNAVRLRAGLEALEGLNADGILLAIENERRLEFALEGDRWFDLVRTERATEVLDVTDPNKLLFPIPYNQTVVDDLDPNPGY